MKSIKRIFLISLVLPFVAFAQLGGVETLIRRVGELALLSIQVVGAIAVLAFFWGLAKFIFKSGDSKAQDEGKNIMKWGLIALFVMFSIWGIISFFQNELLGGGTNGTQVIPLPQQA